MGLIENVPYGHNRLGDHIYTYKYILLRDVAALHNPAASVKLSKSRPVSNFDLQCGGWILVAVAIKL